MRSRMRMALSATTVLGLVLLALALSGISGLAADLEAATPQRVPAPASEAVYSDYREIDCPLPAPDRSQI